MADHTKQLKDGLEVFDGHQVRAYSGKFSGGFDIDTEVGVAVGTDDLVSFVVTARVGKSGLARNTQTGDMVRVNSMKIEEVVALNDQEAKYIYGYVGRLVQGVNDGLLESDSDDGDDLDDDDDIEDLLLTDNTSHPTASLPRLLAAQ